MPSNITVHEDNGVGVVVGEVVGYVAALLFCTTGVTLGLLGWKYGRTMTFGNLYMRVSTYSLVLGLLWPIATLNRFDVILPDTRMVPVALVLLNMLVWMLGMTELLGWLIGYDGNPPHWHVYDLLVWIVRIAIGTLALAGLSNESTRFVALLMVVPLAVAIGWAGVAHAQEARNLASLGGFDWQRPHETWRVLQQQHYVVVMLICIGLGTLISEMLGPLYGNVAGHAWAALTMFIEHLALGALLLFMSTTIAATDVFPTARKESDPSPAVSHHVAAMNFDTTPSRNSNNLLAGFDDD